MSLQAAGATIARAGFADQVTKDLWQGYADLAVRYLEARYYRLADLPDEVRECDDLLTADLHLRGPNGTNHVRP
ncbi:MAG: hypothetical protein AB7L84_00405 [Acidimicrobiia bacterium]